MYRTTVPGRRDCRYRFPTVALLLLLSAALLPGCSRESPAPRGSEYDRALAAFRTGRLADAQAIVAAGELPTGSPDGLRLRLLNVDILLAAGRIDDAERALRDLPANASQSAEAAGRQIYLAARVLVERGRLADALATLQQAPSALGGSTVGLDVLRLEGQIRVRMNDWAGGIARLGEAAARAEAAGDQYRLAQALNDRGMSQLQRGRYDEALPWFERIAALPDVEGTTVLAQALNIAGIASARLGQFARAARSQERAGASHRSGPPRAYLEAVGALGNTFVLQRSPREAVPRLQDAFQTATRLGMNGEAALWAGNLASAHADLGDWDEAERYNAEARRLAGGSDRTNPIYFVLTDAQIAAGRRQHEAASRLFNQVLESKPPAAVRWTAQAALARLAVAEGHPERAGRWFEAALHTIEETRSDLLKADYRLTFLSRLIAFYQDYVDLLMTQGEVERALTVAESSRARVLAERSGGRPIAGQLDTVRLVARRSQTVLISFWLAPRRSFAWIVTDRGIDHVDLPPRAEIDRLVRGYQAVVANAMADPLSRATDGDRLYQAVIDPLRRWLPAGTSAIVVPDGALHGISLDTLPVPGTPRHFLIEEVAFQIAPSLFALDMAKSAGVVDLEPLLLVGAADPHEPEFAALPSAQAEMTHVAGHFPRSAVTALQGAAATPGAVLREARGDFGTIHFTAHAVAQPDAPLDSAIVLSGPDDGYKLYARDIADLQLHAALVTVSACRSAGEGALAGEGLVGFAWAFLRAGTQRVVAGLWDVDDRSTAALMDVFYARLSAGQSPVASLRAAKLALLHAGGSRARPYHWGGLQLFTTVPR
jgi:CHAT domain-containing protein